MEMYLENVVIILDAVFDFLEFTDPVEIAEAQRVDEVCFLLLVGRGFCSVVHRKYSLWNQSIN